MGLSSRVVLFLRAFLSIGQVAAFIVILAISAPVPNGCTDLRTYLAGSVARVAVTFPVSTFVTYCVPSRAPANEDAEHRATLDAIRQ